MPQAAVDLESELAIAVSRRPALVPASDVSTATSASGHIVQAALASSAEKAAIDVRTLLADVSSLAASLEREGNELIADIQRRCQGFQERVAKFAHVSESVQISIKKCANDMAACAFEREM